MNSPSTEASHPPRGRMASSPGVIPARGWKDILLRVYSELVEDRLMLIAAGITFYLLLALVPALTALVSIFSLFSDPQSLREFTLFFNGVVPTAALDIIDEQLNRLTSHNESALSFAFAVSVGLALWSTNSGMKALFDGVNVAYDETESRSFIKYTLTSMTFTFGLVAGLIASIALLGLLPLGLEYVGLQKGADLAIRIAGLLVVLVLMSISISMLYRWGPSRADAQWKWITPGMIVSMIGITIVSLAFSFYVANFGSYDATYGSLGAIIGFMTWIWISTIVLLVGAELNAEVEHQTLVDSTTGAEQPMGERGAVVADTVGVSANGTTPSYQQFEVPPARESGSDGPRKGISTNQLLFAYLVLGAWWLSSRKD